MEKPSSIPPATMDELISDMLRVGNAAAVSDLTEAKLLGQPLSGAVLKLVAERVPAAVLADALDVSYSKLERLVDQTLTRAQSEQIRSLLGLWLQLEELFSQDRKLLDSWMAAPIPAIGGRSTLL